MASRPTTDCATASRWFSGIGACLRAPSARHLVSSDCREGRKEAVRSSRACTRGILLRHACATGNQNDASGNRFPAHCAGDQCLESRGFMSTGLHATSSPRVERMYYDTWRSLQSCLQNGTADLEVLMLRHRGGFRQRRVFQSQTQIGA